MYVSFTFVELVTDGIHECVSSCEGRSNGDYHSCISCHVYATCSNGILYDNRPCPANLVWDDSKKRCEYTSSTCNRGRNDGSCVSDCKGMQNGDYQSCLGCDVYATCSNELLYDNRPCPADLVWDDDKKRCEYESDTCSESGGDNGGGGDNDGGDDGEDNGGGGHGGGSHSHGSHSSSSEDSHDRDLKGDKNLLCNSFTQPRKLNKGFMLINFVDFSDLKEIWLLEGLRETLLAVATG